MILRLSLLSPWCHSALNIGLTLPWALTVRHVAPLITPFQLCAGMAMGAVYGLRLEQDLRATYGESKQLRLRLRSPYSETQRIHWQCTLLYSDRPLLKMRLRSPYWLTESKRKQLTTAYTINNTEAHNLRLMASWSLLADQRLQALAHNPELIWQGRVIAIHQVSLSCDEDSPFWIARIELADLSDFAQIAIGDHLSLQLGAERFAFMVDGKSLSREDSSTQRLELSALSPLAQFDAPFAAGRRIDAPNAQSARSVVEALLGPVSWQLNDWLIPAGHLNFENVTPLQAARTIIGAVGGVLESQSDGTPLARRRHPVSIPQYFKTTPAHTFVDAEVFSRRADIAPQRGFNRVILSNETGAQRTNNDRLELLATDHPQRKILRATLSPVRPVQLVHSGHPDTVITARGELMRIEEEVLEFIDGRSSSRYAISALLSTRWQHQDLGALHIEGQTLIAAINGYSLLSLRYATTALEWSVSLARDEEVQFLLI